MDAIRSYIDQMFRTLPRTPEVRRAHGELVQMSEDRYRELRAEGASDNEAVGRVITQFGNLDELADDLGIRREVDSRAASDVVELSDEDAERFLANRRTGARFIAGGVATILAGLSGFLLLSQVLLADAEHGTPIGLAVFFAGIAVAVGLFIAGGVGMSRFDRLDGRELRLEPATARRYSDLRERETTRFILALGGGVTVILLGVAVVAVGGSVWSGGARESTAAAAVMLLLIGVGAGIIAMAGIRREALERLATAAETPKDSTDSPLIGLVAGPYWMLVVVVFLSWSFLGNAWGQSWIVWPIAAVLFGFVAATISSIEAYRARRARS